MTLWCWSDQQFQLYCTHVLQRFGDRMWAFAVPVLMVNIWPQTLLPAALFQFAMYLVAFFLMAPIGIWIDQSDRMIVMKTAVIGQTGFIIANCVLVWFLLETVPETQELVWNIGLAFTFTLILITASVAEGLGNAATISIERDWVIVIAGTDSEILTRYNAILRRIDLLCAFLAPACFGLVLQLLPSTLSGPGRVRAGTAFIVFWNVVTVVPEYRTAKKLYDGVEALRQKKVITAPATSAALSDADSEMMKQHQKQLSWSQRLLTAVKKAVQESWHSWRIFVSHRVFAPSFSYCALYLTVLDGGTLMMAYLTWAGLPTGVLGLSVGIGALFGVAGTFAFPLMKKRLGLHAAGGLAVCCFFLNVFVGAMVFFAPFGFNPRMRDDPEWTSRGYIMLFAVASARFMLWAFDLAHTQVIQEGVEANLRGTINSCQTACYQLFWVVLALFSMIFSSPLHFSILVTISAAVVCTSACGWTAWALFFSSKPSSSAMVPGDDALILDPLISGDEDAGLEMSTGASSSLSNINSKLNFFGEDEDEDELTSCDL